MDLPKNPQELAQWMDLTLLKPDAIRGDVERYCTVARELKLHGVCVHGSRVVLAKAILEESDVHVITVAGFPMGAADTDVKRYETEVAVDNGAQEIEVVANLGWIKDGEDAKILRELRDVIEAADERPVGVILEAALLRPEEKTRLCQIAVEAGAKSIVTATGFLSRDPVSVEDIKLIRAAVGEKFGIKAAGKVPDSQAALALIQAGATRLAMAEPAALLPSK
jgi:deoxyribose-phosphate aldolase